MNHFTGILTSFNETLQSIKQRGFAMIKKSEIRVNEKGFYIEGHLALDMELKTIQNMVTKRGVLAKVIKNERNSTQKR
jgi:hypothetical protein